MKALAFVLLLGALAHGEIVDPNLAVMQITVKGATVKGAAALVDRCGAGIGGASITNDGCGNTGNPYAGLNLAAPSQNISACGTVNLALGSAQLTTNISAASSADVCLTVINGGGTNYLDFKGYTVTGRVQNDNGISPFAPTHIMNGTISCSSTGTTVLTSCFAITGPGGAGNITTQIRVHHLTINTTANCSGGACAKHAIFVDWNAGTGIAGPDIRFDHITHTIDNADGGGRSYAIRIQTNHDVQLDHNDISATNDAGSAQGLALIGTSNSLITNNKGACAATTTSDDTVRIILVDGGSNNVVVANNYTDSSNCRAIRVRDSTNVMVTDHRFVGMTDLSVTLANTGVVHLGDPDSGTFNMSGFILKDSQFVLAGNDVKLVWTRFATGMTVRGVTVTPGAFSGGYLGFLRDSSTGSAAVTFQNNTLNGWAGTGGNNILAENATTASYSSSGTCGVTGTGTCTAF